MRGIITLCGSTKFRKEFEEVNRELTIAGFVVLSVGGYHHSELNSTIRKRLEDNKPALDALHKEKIAMSQAIVVIDPDGYKGESTLSEIEHAINLGNGYEVKGEYHYCDDSWKCLIDSNAKIKPRVCWSRWKGDKVIPD